MTKPHAQASPAPRFVTAKEDSVPLPATPAPIPIGEQCVLCRCRLTSAYAIARGLCGSCSERPEAVALPRDATGRATRGVRPQAVPTPAAAATSSAQSPTPRAFTPADRSLIKAVHAFMPTAQLLETLNLRRQADQGQHAPPYTLEQLHAEVQTLVGPVKADDWAGLRQLLAAARASGVLEAITMQTVEDFATVYQLSPGQLLHLKDVLLHAKEGR